MAEFFDTVLAEMRADARLENGRLAHDAATGGQLEAWANRLQSAHEAEVAELRRVALHESLVAENAISHADRAVALLRECEDAVFGKELWERIRAFLSEQAGERENGE